MGTQEPIPQVWETAILFHRRLSILLQSIIRKSDTREERSVDSPQVVGLLETTLGDPIRTVEKCGHGHV
jgi:hypothetical protein